MPSNTSKAGNGTGKKSKVKKVKEVKEDNDPDIEGSTPTFPSFSTAKEEIIKEVLSVRQEEKSTATINAYPWDILGSYFKDQHLRQLVRHQIESYNNFVNYQIQKTINMFNARVDIDPIEHYRQIT